MRWFPRRFEWASKPRKTKLMRRRAKAAALAVGLATAWGGEASADVIMRLDVTPTRTLSNTYVYYANNISTASIRSLGVLPANQTTTFTHILNEQYDKKPEYLVPTPSYPRVGYWVIGVFEEGDTPSISVSFPSDSPITSGAQWSDIFGQQDELQLANFLMWSFDSESFLNSNFVAGYGNPGYKPNAILPTHYGEYGTLVNFSTAAFGGTVLATIVPEPTSIVLASAAGVFLMGVCLKRGSKQSCD